VSVENYHLIVRKGPKPGQVFPLLAPTITIGRDPMSDIVLNDPEVSRYHAQLVETIDGYEIHDMGSTNGTYVSGNRIGDEPILLQIGQDIAFGSGIFVLYESSGGQTNQDDFDPFGDDVEPVTAVPDPFSSPPVEPQSPPPYTEQSPPPPPPPPASPTDEDAARKRKQIIAIVVAAIVLLCLCCILALIGMYYWGGDLILRELGVQAATAVNLPLHS
jgi:pSer/pThr/pTyr-binding forkhead associated (FHA) protein